MHNAAGRLSNPSAIDVQLADLLRQRLDEHPPAAAAKPPASACIFPALTHSGNPLAALSAGAAAGGHRAANLLHAVSDVSAHSTTHVLPRRSSGAGPACVGQAGDGGMRSAASASQLPRGQHAHDALAGARSTAPLSAQTALCGANPRPEGTPRAPKQCAPHPAAHHAGAVVVASCAASALHAAPSHACGAELHAQLCLQLKQRHMRVSLHAPVRHARCSPTCMRPCRARTSPGEVLPQWGGAMHMHSGAPSEARGTPTASVTTGGKEGKKLAGKVPVRATSKYRGVTHHCRTNRFESHIWDAGKQARTRWPLS